MASFIDGLMKRVERRALRELENGATKKIKSLLFGEKEVKIEVPLWVRYKRAEIGLKDLVSVGHLDKATKEVGREMLREFRKAHGVLIMGERDIEFEEKCLRFERDLA